MYSVVNFLIMVAPDINDKRAKGPVVVTAYLLHNAKRLVGERGREKKTKEKKEMISLKKRGEKSEAR